MASTLGAAGDLGLLWRTGFFAPAAVLLRTELARLASKSLIASTGWRFSNAANTSGGKDSDGLVIDERRTKARYRGCAP
jgi:hypothetical protein